MGEPDFERNGLEKPVFDCHGLGRQETVMVYNRNQSEASHGVILRLREV